MRTPVIAGNWKMYKTVDQALDFMNALRERGEVSGVEQVVCASFVALPALAQATSGTGVGIGAQTMHWEEEGAYTGEVSPTMLQDIDVPYVIIGHSERRTYFAETDETVNKKTKSALDHDLTPIVCIGETLEEKEADRTQETVRDQVAKALDGRSSAEASRVILAYEPVWAIGTGKSATADDADEVIRFIRKTVADQLDHDVARDIRILYGGSVKPSNIDSFLERPDIDGALVGGASLDPNSFGQLVDAAAKRGDSK
ncbi:triose-phosphate isomerase [Marininema halotolerans]|uniref:Triosephosphate isomerase n=1 Tax=Marininema halotolerans TaxID=1155944 RepID=A0A1I6NW03_9BACL|nr:triose-phosphate isomerase [Marininema halotolerans]SFS32156.1 triosephosphate isomerase (TIM) [Marininema halotolerans]